MKFNKYFQNPLMIKILAAVYNTFGLQKKYDFIQ